MLAPISARAESLDTVDYHYFVAKLENIAVITEGRLNFSIALHQKAKHFISALERSQCNSAAKSWFQYLDVSRAGTPAHQF